MPAQSSTLATTPPATAEPPTSVSAVESADKNTIAVLPFVNMSANPENVFFAEGMAEELLNILAGVDGLKVASRTSAFSFRGKDTPIPQIARELGVRHILEGSVRRQGDRVRITAQLIETESDTHLWSETFERDLVDIFRVQEEIAQSITGALKDVLGVQTVSVAAATADLEAYERFLRGRSRFYQRVDLDEAIRDLRFAVARDSEFAEAWAFLGAASAVVGSGGYPTSLDRSALSAEALEAVERALALDPEITTALAVKGQLLTRSGSAAEIAEGIRLLERAAGRVSADTSPRLWLGLNWLQLGFVERAMPLFASARDQDPMMAINNGYLGLAYAVQGQWEEGSRFVQRAVELSPLAFWTFNVAAGLFHAGRVDDARELLIAARPALVPVLVDLPQFGGEYLEGLIASLDDPERRAAFLAANRYDPARDNSAAAMHAATMFGDANHIFEFDDVSGAGAVMIACAWLPSMGWLREDPRFYQSRRRTGAADFWEAEGYPPGCRPVDDPTGRRLDCSGYGP
jgi:TolB-like protein